MEILDGPRYVCALGAMQTVQAIYRAIPIIHAGPGCAGKLAGSIAGTTGDSGYLNPQTYPCTNIGETEVVFGGENKLRSVIKHALKIMDGDIFIVLSGCTTEIVGDDIDQIVSEFANADKPVISVSTPGFKGTNIQGHEWVVNALINQYLCRSNIKPVRTKGLVNIWSSVPSYDPHWLGNIRTLENLIRQLGLIPNSIFGEFRGKENIDKIPLAEFNLLVSPWVGLESVQLLKEKFGTPYFHYPVLPIGAHETSAFLRAVGDFAGIDKEYINKLVAKHEREYYYYIERSVDIFFENRTASKMFTTVTDATNALAVSKFLINDLGLMPRTQFITEKVPEEHQERVSQYFKFNYDITACVVFSTDSYLIHKQIEQEDFIGSPLIVGSIFEKKLAQKLGGNFVCISIPINEKVILHSTYVGYHGGLKLIEDIFTSVYQSFN